LLTAPATIRRSPAFGGCADSANTSPFVVCRLFSLMTAAAGLIRARLGPGGGFELARPASDINLRDVFAALESGEHFTEHRRP
jgi:DNA-binding IscR family transcriptional regulator